MKMMSTPAAAWRDQGTRWLVVVVVAIAVMLIDIDGLAAYPNFIVGTIAATAIAAVSLNLLTGYGGMFSLATPAFMATGAYGALSEALSAACSQSQIDCAAAQLHSSAGRLWTVAGSDSAEAAGR